MARKYKKQSSAKKKKKCETVGALRVMRQPWICPTSSLALIRALRDSVHRRNRYGDNGSPWQSPCYSRIGLNSRVQKIGRVVTASILTESIPTPDTSVCFESVELGINRLYSVNSAEFLEMTRRLGRRQKNRIPIFY